jgi:hypothetical protein
MKYDEIDIHIIHFLHDRPGQTTTDVAKKLFLIKDSRTLLMKDSLIRARLKKMGEHKVVLCSPTVPKTYAINPEHVFTGQGTFELKVNNGKKVEIDFGIFLAITDGNDSIQIHKIREPVNGEISFY